MKTIAIVEINAILEKNFKYFTFFLIIEQNPKG